MTESVEFPESIVSDAAEIIARYPHSRSALLPLLHLVQSHEGFVSPAGVRFCAERLDMTAAAVTAVATFYTMYKRHPTGEYLVSVCTNTMCGVLGGDDIFAAMSEHFGVGHNETTPDGKVTLEHAECLAACDYAPMLTVNYEFFDRQTPASAIELATSLMSGVTPAPTPTRGAPLCSFRQVSRQLAGFADPRPEALAGVPGEPGDPTLAGLATHDGSQ
jgi:NADH-quinone oxidoreductase subunit E